MTCLMCVGKGEPCISIALALLMLNNGPHSSAR